MSILCLRFEIMAILILNLAANNLINNNDEKVKPNLKLLAILCGFHISFLINMSEFVKITLFMLSSNFFLSALFLLYLDK